MVRPNEFIELSCLIENSFPPEGPRFVTESCFTVVEGTAIADPVTVSVVSAVTLPRLSTENVGTLTSGF